VFLFLLCLCLVRSSQFQAVEAPRISRQPTTRGSGKVVSPTHWQLLPPPPKRHLWYAFLLSAYSNLGPQRPEGLLPPSVMEPANLRFDVQCLKQLHHRVIFLSKVTSKVLRLLLIIHNTIIIIIIFLSWSWATFWSVPVSRIQKSLQRSSMLPSASWGAVFHYPG